MNIYKNIIFHQLDLKITAEINNQTVNFLDITLNLIDQKYSPYRKPNNDPLYIGSRSNHPPSIIKQIPTSVNKRISPCHLTKCPSTPQHLFMRMPSNAVITTSKCNIKLTAPTTPRPPEERVEGKSAQTRSSDTESNSY